ncbi:hypothetical protein [Terrabacter terrae]
MSRSEEVGLMDNTTMTMNAVSCVLSVRLRPATGQGRVATAGAPVQGTTVSAAGMGARVADLRSPIQGYVSVAGVTSAPAFKIPDVVRSRSGRPPV